MNRNPSQPQTPIPIDAWDWLAARFLRSRVAFFFIVVALTAAAIYGTSYEAPAHFSGVRSLEAKDPKTEASERLRREVTNDFRLQRPDLFLVLSVQRAPKQVDVRAMRRAVAAVEQLPQVAEALWIDDVPSINVFELTRSILPSDLLSDQGFQEEMEVLERHPLGRGQLVSIDGRSFLVAVRLDWLEINNDQDAVEALIATARNAIAESPSSTSTGSTSTSSTVSIESTQGSVANAVSVDATGDVPLYLDQLTAHRSNQAWFEMLGYTLVIVVASVLYRSPAPVILVAIAPATAIFWSKALLRWMGEPANPLSDSVLPVLVAIVGVTDGVHLLAQYRHELAQGRTAREAAAAAIRHVGNACFLTSLTTAIGFSSLIWADSDLVRGFGRSCALGVTLAFVSIMTVFPLIASLRLVARWVPGSILDEGSSWHADRWILPWLRFPWLNTIVGVLLTVLMTASLLSLQPDEKRAYGLPSKSAAFQTLQQVDEKFSGIETAQVVIQWPAAADDTAELLEVIRDVGDVIAAENEVGRPLSMATLRDSLVAPPETQIFDFVSLLPSALRDSLYRPDLRRTVVSFRVEDLGVAKLEPIFREMNVELKRIAAQHAGYSIDLTGDGVVRGRLVARVVRDLEQSLFAAGLIIFVLLAIALRSVKYGIIAIVPNLFPITFAAAGLWLLGRQLDVSAACAFTVCLGIAVDDTIHFLSRYQQLRAAGLDTEAAIRMTMRKVGGALIMTTVIMTVGFGTVISSEMPAQRIFGSLSVVTILAALFGDLLILPAMLRVFDRGTKPGSNRAALKNAAP